MNLIHLTAFDLGLAALLVVLLGGLIALNGLGLTRSLFVSSLRMTLQLLLIGVVLEALFRLNNPWLVLMMGLVMLAVAGWEVVARQKRRLRGGWGYGIGLLAMALPAFTLTLFTLVVLVGVQPWYTPQYAIPLLGMIFGQYHDRHRAGLQPLDHGRGGQSARNRSAVIARLRHASSLAQAASRQPAHRHGTDHQYAHRGGAGEFARHDDRADSGRDRTD